MAAAAGAHPAHQALADLQRHFAETAIDPAEAQRLTEALKGHLDKVDPREVKAVAGSVRAGVTALLGGQKLEQGTTGHAEVIAALTDVRDQTERLLSGAVEKLLGELKAQPILGAIVVLNKEAAQRTTGKEVSKSKLTKARNAIAKLLGVSHQPPQDLQKLAQLMVETGKTTDDILKVALPELHLESLGEAPSITLEQIKGEKLFDALFEPDKYRIKNYGEKDGKTVTEFLKSVHVRARGRGPLRDLLGLQEWPKTREDLVAAAMAKKKTLADLVNLIRENLDLDDRAEVVERPVRKSKAEAGPQRPANFAAVVAHHKGLKKTDPKTYAEHLADFRKALKQPALRAAMPGLQDWSDNDLKALLAELKEPEEAPTAGAADAAAASRAARAAEGPKIQEDRIPAEVRKAAKGNREVAQVIQFLDTVASLVPLKDDPAALERALQEEGYERTENTDRTLARLADALKRVHADKATIGEDLAKVTPASVTELKTIADKVMEIFAKRHVDGLMKGYALAVSRPRQATPAPGKAVERIPDALKETPEFKQFETAVHALRNAIPKDERANSILQAIRRESGFAFFVVNQVGARRRTPGIRTILGAMNLGIGSRLEAEVKADLQLAAGVLDAVRQKVVGAAERENQVRAIIGSNQETADELLKVIDSVFKTPEALKAVRADTGNKFLQAVFVRREKKYAKAIAEAIDGPIEEATVGRLLRAHVAQLTVLLLQEENKEIKKIPERLKSKTDKLKNLVEKVRKQRRALKQARKGNNPFWKAAFQEPYANNWFEMLQKSVEGNVLTRGNIEPEIDRQITDLETLLKDYDLPPKEMNRINPPALRDALHEATRENKDDRERVIKAWQLFQPKITPSTSGGLAKVEPNRARAEGVPALEEFYGAIDVAMRQCVQLATATDDADDLSVVGAAHALIQKLRNVLSVGVQNTIEHQIDERDMRTVILGFYRSNAELQGKIQRLADILMLRPAGTDADREHLRRLKHEVRQMLYKTIPGILNPKCNSKGDDDLKEKINLLEPEHVSLTHARTQAKPISDAIDTTLNDSIRELAEPLQEALGGMAEIRGAPPPSAPVDDEAGAAPEAIPPGAPSHLVGLIDRNKDTLRTATSVDAQNRLLTQLFREFFKDYPEITKDNLDQLLENTEVQGALMEISGITHILMDDIEALIRESLDKKDEPVKGPRNYAENFDRSDISRLMHRVLKRAEAFNRNDPASRAVETTLLSEMLGEHFDQKINLDHLESFLLKPDVAVSDDVKRMSEMAERMRQGTETKVATLKRMLADKAEEKERVDGNIKALNQRMASGRGGMDETGKLIEGLQDKLRAVKLDIRHIELAIQSETGHRTYKTPHEVLAMIFIYLHKERGERGGLQINNIAREVEDAINQERQRLNRPGKVAKAFSFGILKPGLKNILLHLVKEVRDFKAITPEDMEELIRIHHDPEQINDWVGTLKGGDREKHYQETIPRLIAYLECALHDEGLGQLNTLSRKKTQVLIENLRKARQNHVEKVVDDRIRAKGLSLEPDQKMVLYFEELEAYERAESLAMQETLQNFANEKRAVRGLKGALMLAPAAYWGPGLAAGLWALPVLGPLALASAVPGGILIATRFMNESKKRERAQKIAKRVWAGGAAGIVAGAGLGAGMTAVAGLAPFLAPVLGAIPLATAIAAGVAGLAGTFFPEVYKHRGPIGKAARGTGSALWLAGKIGLTVPLIAFAWSKLGRGGLKKLWRSRGKRT